MDGSEGNEEQLSSPTFHTLRTLERTWTGGSNESVQQWIDSLTEVDLHGTTERPATPLLEIESRTYGDIHFLPIPGTGDDELLLGAEAKSLSRAGSEGGYSSYSPRLSPMIFENSERPEFPICNDSCEGEFERFEGDELSKKMQPQDSQMNGKCDFKQMSAMEAFTHQSKDMTRKKPALTKQESFASFQSVSSLLAAMESDPEDVLQSLGFPDASWSPFNRIPIRFLTNSSQAKGIDVQKFCAQFMDQGDQESVSIAEEESKKGLLTRFSQSSIDLSLVDNEDGIQARIRRAKYRQSSIPSITVDIEDDEISGSDKNSQTRMTGFLRLSTVMEENEPSSRKSSFSRSFSNEKRAQLHKQERVDVTDLENSVFGSIDKENVDINIEAVVTEEKPIKEDSKILKNGVDSQKLERREKSFENGNHKKDQRTNSVEIMADNRQNLFNRRIQTSGDETGEGKELKLLIPDRNNNSKSDKRIEICRPALNYISNGEKDRKGHETNKNGNELRIPDVIVTENEIEGPFGVTKVAPGQDISSGDHIEDKIEESAPNVQLENFDSKIEEDDVESVSPVESLIDSIEIDACSFADSIEIENNSKQDKQEITKNMMTPGTNSNEDCFVRQFSEDSLETDEPSLSETRNAFILEEQPIEMDDQVPPDADRPPSRIVYRSLGKIENLVNDMEDSGSSERNGGNEFENDESTSLRKGGIFGSLPFLSKSRKRTSSGSSFGVNSEKCHSRNTSDIEARSTRSDSYPFMKSKKRRSSTRIRDYFHKLVNGNVPSFTSNSSLDQSSPSRNQSDSSHDHINKSCDQSNTSCERNNSSPNQENSSCDQNDFSNDENNSSCGQYRRAKSHEDVLSETSCKLNSRTMTKQNNSLPVENGNLRYEKGNGDVPKTQSLDNLSDERRDIGSEKSRPSGFERLISLLRSKEGPVSKAKMGDVRLKDDKLTWSRNHIGSKKGEETKKSLTDGIINRDVSKLPTNDKVARENKGHEVITHDSNKKHSNRNADTSEVIRESTNVEFQESQLEISQPEVIRKEKSREGFDPTGNDAVERISSRMLTKGYSVESSGFEDEADICKLTLERGRNIMDDGKRLLCMDCMQRRIGETILEKSLSTASGTSHEERDRNHGPKLEVNDVKSFAEGEKKEPRNSTPLYNEKSSWLEVNHFDFLVGQVTSLRKDLTEQEDRMKTYIDESMERVKTSILTELSILNASFKTGSLDMSHQTEDP